MTRSQNIFWRQAIRDLAMALGVLALVFLSFGHQPVAAPKNGAEFAISNLDIASFCGGVPAGGQAGRKGCDACRLAYGIALPPAPCLPVARFTLAISVADIPDSGFLPAGILNRIQHQRAPPFV